MKEKEKAIKYDEGKPMFQLIPAYAHKQVAHVFTYGHTKYEKEAGGGKNWEKGMPWTKMLGAVERHINAFKAGEDIDDESGLFHLAHAATDILMMIEWYRTHPELDDRKKDYLTQPKITLDIDEVVCQWQKGYNKRFNREVDPRYWNQSYAIGTDLDILKEEKDFWINLESYHMPDFEPHAYVSSRSIPVEWSQEFIAKTGLPCAPIYHVPFGASKIEVLKKIGSEIHIDDSFKNFKECEENGITAFLMDAPHNRHYNVGYRRIKDLQIKNIIR